MSPWSKHGQRSRSNQPPYPTPTREQEIVAERAQFLRVYDKTVETLESIKKERQNMSDYVYTESLLNSNSTAIKAAYYNVDDKTLLVVMRENGNAYRYDGVPSWVWSDFKRSDSLGRFFANTVKRSYGPSKYLGVGKNLSITQKGAVASVTPLRPTYSLSSTPVSASGPQTVGTPKGLTLASDAKVTTKAEAFPAKAALRKHEIVFTALTDPRERVYAVESEDIETALSQLDEVAEMLDINFKVKRVTVHFE